MADDLDYAPAISPEDEEEQKRKQYGDYPPPTPAKAAASDDPPAPNLPSPQIKDLNMSATPAPMPTLAPTPAQSRLKTLTDQGAPPVQPLHGWKKALDIAGQVLAPARPIEQALRYGPQQRYAQNLASAQGDVAAETAAQKGPAEVDQERAKAEQERAKAQALTHPPDKAKEENWQPFAGFTDNDGTPLIHEANSGQVVRASDKKPPSGFKAAAPKNDRPDTPEQQFIDEFMKTHPNATVAQAIASYSSTTQKPERPDKPQRMLGVINGKIVELTPGMEVPDGTKSLTGDLAGSKPSPDEQRRADLSENLNENLATLEEIVSRRPELFGPVAGRWTGLKGSLGSDDPDIGALETIKHQIGMAQISAHGMRSAQGIGSAADSIMNSFKNGPEAMKASINAARNSVKTFTGDAARATHSGAPAPAQAQGGDLGPANGKPDGATGTLPDGTKVVVKGGRVVRQ